MKTLLRWRVRNPDCAPNKGVVAGITLTLVTLGAWLVFSAATPNDVVRAAESIPRAFGQIPLSFTVNQGQADPRVKFLSQGPGYKLSLTSGEAVLTLSSPASSPRNSVVDAPIAAGVAFKMILADGNCNAEVEGLEELPGKSNYFIGKDPKKWRTNVPTYARVKYHEVYPGVDLVYYGNQQQLEYDLVVAPLVDPRVIRVSFEGAEKLTLAANGDLVVSLGGAELRQLKPVVFQEEDGEIRKTVECRYVVKGENEVAFALGPYDRDRPLVIDPLLVFSTTGIGGQSIALDSAGNVYLTGSQSIQATPGAFQTTPGGGYDASVVKLNASGTALVYATYLGGSGSDHGNNLDVDVAGNVYVVGSTNSPDFPVSAGAVQSRLGGGNCPDYSCRDVFVARLNVSGSELIYSTYAGGMRWDYGAGIKTDSAGNAYITGSTQSSDFPVTEGVFQTRNAGGDDAFVMKLNPSGTDIIYSTYVGTNTSQFANDIALNDTGEVYITGDTYGFPTTPGAFTMPYCTIFVTKLNASGTALVYSSCFSLAQDTLDFDYDVASGIAVDAAGNAYVSGTLYSPLYKPFVLKLNPTGSALVYTVTLGGDGFGGNDITVDAFGTAYVTGETYGNLTVTDDAIQKEKSGETCPAQACLPDAFVAKLSPSGKILYSSYLGGNLRDSGESIAIDVTGSILVAGNTESANFLTTPGSYQSQAGVGSFLLKFAPDVSSVSAAHYNISPIARSAIVAAFGPRMATMTETAYSIPLPLSLAGSQVQVKDSAGVEHPALLFYASPTQINYQVPVQASPGPALVTVTSGDGRISTGLMTITSVAPALFTINQSGSGPAAAMDAITFTDAPFAATQPNGQPNIIALFGTGLGADATDLDTSVNVSSSVEVTIDGNPATTVFAGSASGYTGLNQFNVVLPAGISSGNHTIVVSRNGVKSNLVTIAIR